MFNSPGEMHFRAGFPGHSALCGLLRFMLTSDRGISLERRLFGDFGRTRGSGVVFDHDRSRAVVYQVLFCRMMNES